MAKDLSEIGRARKLKVDRDYLLHIEAEPLAFARFLKLILDTEKNEDGSAFSQRELAAYLREVGYDITQPVVHKYLSVLTLEQHYIRMIEADELQFFIAYRLSRLTPDQRSKVLDIAQSEAVEAAEEAREQGEEAKEPKIRIYGRHIDQVKRKTIVSSDLFDQLMKQEDFTDPYESVSDEHRTDLSAEQVDGLQGEKVIDHSELNTLIGLLKMRAVEAPNTETGEMGRVKSADLQMYAAQSSHVQKAMQTVSDIMRRALEQERYTVK